MPKLGLGWTPKHEFRTEGDDEPYEYIFEWLAPGEPVHPGAPNEWGAAPRG
jgi:hypothetical protein